ncbi:THUMP-like domain-containing protein [Formosa sp. A9]|uniref:THUMP-like domain-containing protein n=1 Tax=Formosa sp. A9 TaxID=3442641 RepID=UPI003EBA9C8A
MNKDILNTEVQYFINENLNTIAASILLKKPPFEYLDTRDIIEQIEAKKRCFKKLPSWYHTPGIYYPNKLNIEQTSSEITANYKAALISGNSIIDITGGFGVDCLAFSKHFDQVTHCEINEDLSKIVAHNYTQLNANIKTIATDGLAYLKATNETFDWIYIDPSRRHDSKGKVFFLNDCMPNVPEHLSFLFSKSKHILVKTSPLLDITIGYNELKHVKNLHIVAVNNEVKELLWILERDAQTADFSICTTNITKTHTETFNFLPEDESRFEAEYHTPLHFIYEPNAAILKSGGFNAVANQLQIYKLHKHSHLYTSEQYIEFPGRSFKVLKTLDYNKKTLQKENINKANITTRNFPETVEQLRKKLKIKDGGDLYLFFTTDYNSKKLVLICEKIVAKP